MNILIYNLNEPLPEQGGMERVTDLLARLLKEKGFNVLLLCQIKNRQNKNYISPVPIFYLPDRNLIDSSLNKEFFISCVTQNKIDLVIDQTQGGIIGRFGIFKNKEKSIFSHIKLVAVLHNSALSYLQNIHIILRKDTSPFMGRILNDLYIRIKKINGYRMNKILYKEFSSNYDAIVVLSESLFQEVQFFAPKVDVKKLYAIPNPNTYEFIDNPIPKQKEILFVGRMDNKAKGIDRLLKIWKLLAEKNDDWNLTLIGDGPDKPMLEEMAREMGLKRYEFKGYLNPKPYYEKASIFCMTSTFEGFGMVITEAMQHGVIPLAFDSYTTVHDIIKNGYNGFLIKPFDIDEYARKIQILIDDKNLLEELSYNSRLFSNKFSSDEIVSKWITLISDIDEDNH